MLRSFNSLLNLLSVQNKNIDLKIPLSLRDSAVCVPSTPAQRPICCGIPNLSNNANVCRNVGVSPYYGIVLSHIYVFFVSSFLEKSHESIARVQRTRVAPISAVDVLVRCTFSLVISYVHCNYLCPYIIIPIH